VITLRQVSTVRCAHSCDRVFCGGWMEDFGVYEG